MNIARVPPQSQICICKAISFIDVLVELQGNEKGKGVRHCLGLNDIEIEITYLNIFNIIMQLNKPPENQTQ